VAQRQVGEARRPLTSPLRALWRRANGQATIVTPVTSKGAVQAPRDAATAVPGLGLVRAKTNWTRARGPAEDAETLFSRSEI
jgi:hypothetical protein